VLTRASLVHRLSSKHHNALIVSFSTLASVVPSYNDVTGGQLATTGAGIMGKR